MRTNNLTFDEDLWEKANILAVRKRMSFNALVRDALVHYVNGDHVDGITIDEKGKIHPPEAENKLRKKA